VAAVAAIQALGATTVTVASPSSAAPVDILTPEFKRDLNAYLSRLPASAPMKSLADIIAYNTAHAADATKYGQTQLTASQATDLTDPAANAAYVTARDTQRRNAQLAIDNGLSRGTADPADDVEAIMTPSGSLTGIGARAGYPQLVVPAGYAAGSRDPVGIAFNGTAYSEAKLLAFGYAYEQRTLLRKPPSEINPSLWRCVPGNAYTVATRACAPNTPADADAVSTTISGVVPATLSLTLGAPATFGAFTPGIARTYTASTTANVISSAGDAALIVADPSANHPGHLVAGAFFLPQPLQGLGTVKTYSGPGSNDLVTVLFTQPIAATDALRTGSYSKTLTFTLSTTSP
jgi:amidase